MTWTSGVLSLVCIQNRINYPVQYLVPLCDNSIRFAIFCQLTSSSFKVDTREAQHGRSDRFNCSFSAPWHPTMREF